MNMKYAAYLLAGALALSAPSAAGAEPNIILGENGRERTESESENLTETETETEAGTEGESENLEQTETEMAMMVADTEASNAGIETAEPEQDQTADESVRPANPEETGTSAEEAVVGARALYSKMKHFAEKTDNERFSACFEDTLDAATIQSQMKAIQSADQATKDFEGHADVCYFDPTEDKTQSPYYFGVGLADYKVNDDGTVDWYSVLMRVARYGDDWKASVLPDGSLMAGKYPEGYEAAVNGKRNAVDLYPYLALRFSDQGVFDGAFYSLINMVWQNEDGSLSLALWLANGKEGTKWCDSIDLQLQDGSKTVAAVNAPVQQAVESGQSSLVTVNIPAENVKTGTAAWKNLTVQSNLLYQ